MLSFFINAVYVCERDHPFFYCCAIIVLTEMQESHVHRNYSAGEVSTRLYVKNLAKQVEEKVHACMHFNHDKTQFTFHYNNNYYRICSSFLADTSTGVWRGKRTCQLNR